MGSISTVFSVFITIFPPKKESSFFRRFILDHTEQGMLFWKINSGTIRTAGEHSTSARTQETFTAATTHPSSVRRLVKRTQPTPQFAAGAAAKAPQQPPCLLPAVLAALAWHVFSCGSREQRSAQRAGFGRSRLCVLLRSLRQRTGLGGRQGRLEGWGCVLSTYSATSPRGRLEVHNLHTKATERRESEHSTPANTGSLKQQDDGML